MDLFRRPPGLGAAAREAPLAGHEFVVGRCEIGREQRRIALVLRIPDGRQDPAQRVILLGMGGEIAAEVGRYWTGLPFRSRHHVVGVGAALEECRFLE